MAPSPTMSIRAACGILGFKVPPVDKKQLKDAFVARTQRYHPDKGGPEASTAKMTELTEAYRLLRGMLDKRIGGASRGATGHADVAQPGGHDPTTDAAQRGAEAAAANFHAPGFASSSDGVWLPWQREPCSHTRRHDAAVMHQPTATCSSFATFVASARAAEQRVSEARTRAQGAAEGSHGFTAQHLEAQRLMRERAAVAAGRPTRSAKLHVLARIYFAQKCREAPQRLMRSIRFIVLGR